MHDKTVSAFVLIGVVTVALIAFLGLKAETTGQLSNYLCECQISQTDWSGAVLQSEVEYLQVSGDVYRSYCQNTCEQHFMRSYSGGSSSVVGVPAPMGTSVARSGGAYGR